MKRLIPDIQFWLTQNKHRWLPPLIAASTLLLSVGLAMYAPQRYVPLILALIPGIVLLLILMRWPPLGLIALIGTLAISFEGPAGSNAAMALVVLMSGLWLLDMIVRQRQIKLIASKPILPLLSLVLVAFLAFGVGQIPWYSFVKPASMAAQIGGLSIFILSAAAFLLVAHQVRDIRWLQWMHWIFFAVGAVYVIARLFPPLHQIARLYSRGANGSIFWTWLTVLSFSQAVFNRKLHPGWRVLIGSLTLVTLYFGVVIMRAWNSGWVPALVAIALTLTVAKPRLGLVFVALGLVGGITQIQKLIDFIMIGDNEYSLSTRLEAWAIVLNIAKVNPILGLGPSNYYRYTPLFPIRGWAVAFNSHSQYVDLIAQTGLLGLASFLWFFAATGWLGWRLRNRVPEGFARAYVYGVIGGIGGTLVSAALGDWVLPFFYNVGLVAFVSSVLAWLFMGGLVALEQMELQPGGSLKAEQLRTRDRDKINQPQLHQPI